MSDVVKTAERILAQQRLDAAGEEIGDAVLDLVAVLGLMLVDRPSRVSFEEAQERTVLSCERLLAEIGVVTLLFTMKES